MSKKPITERPIHVYTCLSDPSRKCVALIDGWPMIFKGETPMKAKRVADDFRREAILNDKAMTREQKSRILGEDVQ